MYFHVLTPWMLGTISVNASATATPVPQTMLRMEERDRFGSANGRQILT
jgi:hypothetical protein